MENSNQTSGEGSLQEGEIKPEQVSDKQPDVPLVATSTPYQVKLAYGPVPLESFDTQSRPVDGFQAVVSTDIPLRRESAKA